MASNKKPPTVASLSAVLAELVERVKEQDVQILYLQNECQHHQNSILGLLECHKDQQTWNDLQVRRSDRLAETDETIDSFLSRTHGQLQQLKVRCDSEFVTGATFQEEMERQGRALDHAAQQAYLTLQRELRTEWSGNLAVLRSELAHLRGFVEGMTTGFAQRHGYLEERVDAISEYVYRREGWRDRLGRWRWWIGEQLFRITHRRQWKEAQENDRYTE